MCTLHASLVIVVFAHTCCSFTLYHVVINGWAYLDSSVATDVTTTVTIVVSTVIIEVVNVIKGSVTSILCSDEGGNTVESSLVDIMLEPDVDGTM